MLALRCTVLFLALLPATAQEPNKDLAGTIAKHQAYLERHPHHEQSFERWVSDAAAAGTLAALVTHYEERLAADGEDLAARVLLARLLGQRGEFARAIALLAEVKGPDADLEHLLGRFHAADRNPLLASVYLKNAAEKCTDPRTKEAVLEELGSAYVELGLPERAAESFRALAAIDPKSFALRMEAASRLVLCDALDAALEELAVALELAEGDPARRARVLSEIGGVEERAGRPERALDAYREARAVLGRGHWLQRELFTRMLAIQERRGALDELVALCREGVDSDPLDPQMRLDLAHALDRTGNREAASSALLDTATTFPDDLELGRRIIDRLLSMGRVEDASGQYERLLAAHPEAIDLALDLGHMLAARGDREGARARWLRAVELSPTDAGLLRTVGIELLATGWNEDAVALFSRAIAVDSDVRMALELAGKLEERGWKSIGKGWISAAEESARARGDALALEVLADHWAEKGDARRARMLYQQALDAGGDRPRLLERCMDLALVTRDLAAGMSCFRELADGPAEPQRVLEWTAAIVHAHSQGRATDRLLAEEQSRTLENEALAPVLLIAQIQRERHDWDASRGPLVLQIAQHPEQAAPRVLLARVEEDAGEPALAAALYEGLVEVDAARARHWLDRAANAWYVAGEWKRLRACHERMTADSPRDADLVREIATFYRKHAHPAEALDFLERAVTVRPDDGRARLELAELEAELGRTEQANANLRLALVSRDAEVRGLACARLELFMSTPADHELLLRDLQRDFDSDPRQTGLALALAQLLARDFEYERAIETLDRALERSPRDEALSAARHGLLVYANHFEAALRDVDEGGGGLIEPGARLALKMADAELAGGGIEAARALLAGVNAPDLVVALYGRHARFADALHELDRGAKGASATSEDSTEARVHRRMQRADLLRRAGRLRSAGEELAAIALEHPPTRPLLLQQGEIAARLGDRKRSLACGTALFGLCSVRVPRDAGRPTDSPASKAALSWLASPTYAERVAEVQRFFAERRLFRELAELADAEVRAEPWNLPLLDLALAAYGGWGRERAQALLGTVERITTVPGGLPAGQDLAAWKQELAERQARLVRPSASSR